MKKVYFLLVALMALVGLGAHAAVVPTSVYPKAGNYDYVSNGGGLSYVNVYFSQALTLTASPAVTVTGGAQEVTVSSVVFNDLSALSAGMYLLRIEFAEAIEYDGSYTLTIPAGTLTNDANESNSELTYVYTIVNGKKDVEAAEIELLWADPDPEAGPIIGFPANTPFSVKISNYENVAEIWGDMLDLDNPDTSDNMLFSWKEFKKGDDGVYTWVHDVDYTFPMYQGHRYQLTLTCWDRVDVPMDLRTVLATFVLYYEGAIEPSYSFSDVTITSVNPTPGEIITEDNCMVTLTFSDAVHFEHGYATAGGQGAGMRSFTATNVNGLGTQWRLNMPASALGSFTGDISYIVGFTDDYGRWIRPTNTNQAHVTQYYNSTTQGRTDFLLHYTCLGGAVTVDVDPADGSEVTSLKTFTFTNPHSTSMNVINWAWLTSVNSIELYDAAGTRVSMGATIDVEGSDKVVISLDKEITDNGTYSLVVPYTAFALGEETTADMYRGQTCTYTITGNTTTYDLEPSQVTPAHESEVAALETIELLYSQDIAINENANVPIVASRSGEIHTGSLSVRENRYLVFTLDTPITGEGKYYFTLGKGTMGTQAWVDSNLREGQANPETTYVWTVKDPAGIAGIGAEAGEAAYYDLLGRAVATPQPGMLLIKRQGGKAIKVLVK